MRRLEDVEDALIAICKDANSRGLTSVVSESAHAYSKKCAKADASLQLFKVAICKIMSPRHVVILCCTYTKTNRLAACFERPLV